MYLYALIEKKSSKIIHENQSGGSTFFFLMDENVDFSIIIPTLNEESNVSILISEIFSVFKEIGTDNFELFFVDDNSKDKTVSQIKAFDESKITVIERPSKMGIGSAYKEAFPLTKGKYIVIMDADLSHQPKALKDFYKVLKSRLNGEDSLNNLVISSTRYNKGGKVVNWSTKRILISKLANFFGRTVLNIKCSDITGSYRLYSRDVFTKIARKTKSNGFNFQLEAIFYATRYNATIEEVPITFVDREKGKSKLNFQEVINFFLTVIRLFFVLILVRY